MKLTLVVQSLHRASLVVFSISAFVARFARFALFAGFAGLAGFA